MRPSPQVSHVITPRSGNVYRLIDGPQSKSALKHQKAPENTVNTVLIPRWCNSADIVCEMKNLVQAFFFYCVWVYTEIYNFPQWTSA